MALMKIFLSPQVSDRIISYHFEKDKIIATYGKVKEEFDFTGLPNGQLELTNPETGESLLETKLPVMPILSAKKEKGVLWVELLNWISEDASELERFPEWMDADEYSPPTEESPADEEVKEPPSALEGWDEF